MFSQKLKALRKEKGITQQGLADAINISRSTIAGYEIENKQPSYEVIAKIAKYFSVSTDFLLGMDDLPITTPTENTSETKNGCFFFFFDNSLKDIFVSRFNKALNDKKLTIGEFSSITAIDIERCNSYLNGECEPSLEDLVKIADVLNVSIDYLLNNSKRKRITAEEEKNHFLRVVPEEWALKKKKGRENRINEIFKQTFNHYSRQTKTYLCRGLSE